MNDARIATPLDTRIAEHTFFVNKDKPCFYNELLQVGMPAIETSHLLPGTSTADRIATWCMGTWYLNMPLMKFMVDFIRSQPKEGKVFHSTQTLLRKEACEGFFLFLESNIDTISQLVTGFDFKKGFNPFAPKVDKAILEMSYADRQELMRKNREGRLELASGES